MGTRAGTLADELQRVTDEVVTFVEAVPDEAWQRTCADEQCTVAALACHIADGYSNILDSLVKPITEGQEGPRFSQEDLARWNAAAAESNAAQPKVVALERLRTQAPPVITYVRALSDEQLERSRPLPFGGDPMTAEAVIEHVLIGHPRGHLASMQAATS
jgi:uncharacterized damage-inducible protein DinB